MKQVQIIATCDACTEETLAAHSHEITLDQHEKTEVDLCDEHKHLIDTVYELINMGHRTIEEKTPPKSIRQPALTRQPHPCPICGAKISTKKNLDRHVLNIHGRPTPKDDRFACPDCDFHALAAQGLGAHRRAKHGIAGTSDFAVSRRLMLEQARAS